MIVCDTGPLVAAALSNDDDHHACVELLTGLRLAERQVLVPATVVAEVGYLLAREAGAAIESMFLRSLSNGDLVPVELGTDDYARFSADGRPWAAPKRAVVAASFSVTRGVPVVLTAGLSGLSRNPRFRIHPGTCVRS